MDTVIMWIVGVFVCVIIFWLIGYTFEMNHIDDQQEGDEDD